MDVSVDELFNKCSSEVCKAFLNVDQCLMSGQFYEGQSMFQVYRFQMVFIPEKL